MKFSIQNNLNNLLSALNTIGPKKGRKVISNYDIYVHEIQTEINVEVINNYLDIAKIHHVMENEWLEKGSLFNAMCEIKAQKITDTDLNIANMQDYISGDILTLNSIEKRLKELGEVEWYYF